MTILLTVLALAVLATLCATASGTLVDRDAMRRGLTEVEAGVRAGLTFLTVYTTVLAGGLVIAL